MNITVNGVARDVLDDLVLGDLLTELNAGSRGSAAAVDGEVIPRGEWATCVLVAGQSVEVLTAVQGG
jgi:sulfur carrier protein